MTMLWAFWEHSY